MDEELNEIPTRTYKVVNGRVTGFVEGQEAMCQAIEKALSTERFAYEIYSDSYGAEFNDLIGEHLDLAKAEIERLVTEVVTTDERVISVDNFEITNETRDALTIKFVVSTVFGNLAFDQEVMI